MYHTGPMMQHHILLQSNNKEHNEMVLITDNKLIINNVSELFENVDNCWNTKYYTHHLLLLKSSKVLHYGAHPHPYPPPPTPTPIAGNTKGESITLLLTSCLTGLESAVWQLTIFVIICKTDKSKPVKQEVNGTVILSPLVFPAHGFQKLWQQVVLLKLINSN
jgi:hypothetical protein